MWEADQRKELTNMRLPCHAMAPEPFPPRSSTSSFQLSHPGASSRALKQIPLSSEGGLENFAHRCSPATTTAFCGLPFDLRPGEGVFPSRPSSSWARTRPGQAIRDRSIRRPELLLRAAVSRPDPVVDGAQWSKNGKEEKAAGLGAVKLTSPCPVTRHTRSVVDR